MPNINSVRRTVYHSVSPPELVRGLPRSFGPTSDFDQRAKERFPIGSDQEKLAAELRHQRFASRPTTRRDGDMKMPGILIGPSSPAGRLGPFCGARNADRSRLSPAVTVAIYACSSACPICIGADKRRSFARGQRRIDGPR